MNAMELIESAASIVWRLSWQAAALVLVVLAMQRVFRGRLAPAWRHALWFLVLTRLLLPVSWESGFSVYNLMPRTIQSESRPSHYATMDGRSEALPPTPFEIEKESSPSRAEPDLIPTHQQSSSSVSAPVQHAESVPVLEAPISAERWTWQQALAMMWLGGLLLMSARLAGGYLWFASRLRRDGQVEDPAVLEMFKQCRELMRVRTRVRLQETGAVETPGLFGLIRLRLLLPAGLIGRLSRAELRHVFLHELAHVRRRDVLVNWLVAALQAVHWFNPILWFAFHRLRADREVACDALVLARTGAADRRQYGQTILRLLESCARPRSVTGVVGILEDRQQLKGRMRMIARFDGARRSLGLGLALALGVAVVGLTDARTPEPDPKETRSDSATGMEGAEQTGETDATGGDDSTEEIGEDRETDESGIQDEDGQTLEALFEEDPLDAGTDVEAASPEETEPSDRPVEPRAPARADDLEPANANTDSPARRRIMAKLDRFILPEVQFNGLPLGEVIRILDEMAVTIDPDNEGVNFLVNSYIDALTAPQATHIDPATGRPRLLPPAEPKNLKEDVFIYLTPTLKNVRLSDVLDAVVKVADHPIQYTIQDYAIVFAWRDPSARSDAGSPPLFSRTFNVDPQLLIRELEDWRARRQRLLPDGEWQPSLGTSDDPLHFSAPSLHRMLSEYCRAAGADFPARENDGSIRTPLFFNDRLGKVSVRATMQDIEIVERVIQNLGKPRKRVELEVKVIEISPSAFDELTVLRAPGDGEPTDHPEAGSPQSGNLRSTEEPAGNGPNPRAYSYMLPDPEFQEVIRSLEWSGKARTLSDHRVITPSGRVTRFIAEEDPAGELGVDVNPYVLADGSTLELKITALPEEFLLITDGATIFPEEARKRLPAFVWWRGESMTVVMKRDSGTLMLVGATMVDEQTGALELPVLGDLEQVERFFRIRNRTPTRIYLFLIKGTVIESAVDPVKP